MKEKFRIFLEKSRSAIYKFMYGRNGVDELSNFLLRLCFVFLIPCLFLKGYARLVFYLLFWISVIYSYFRILSKNIIKRQKENAWFKGKMNYLKKRFYDRKQFKYFDCPKCKTHLRVPKGAGEITITCKKCGYEFDRKA